MLFYLEKILVRRGEPARKALAGEETTLRRALADLHERDCRTTDIEPLVPWDHQPGTPGWRAEVARAKAALTRLLRHLKEPQSPRRSGDVHSDQDNDSNRREVRVSRHAGIEGLTLST